MLHGETIGKKTGETIKGKRRGTTWKGALLGAPSVRVKGGEEKVLGGRVRSDYGAEELNQMS